MQFFTLLCYINRLSVTPFLHSQQFKKFINGLTPTKLNVMKKVGMIIAVIMTISFGYLNAKATKDESVSKLNGMVAEGKPFNAVVVNNNVNVVLLNNSASQVVVKGNPDAVGNIDYYVRRGILYVDTKDDSKAKNVTVYISANQLKSIEVTGSSLVQSQDTINNRLLKMIMNGEGKFVVKNRGRVLVTSDNDIDLFYKKNNVDYEMPIELANRYFD